MTRPILVVIAGPNGAGKTTVTKKLRQHEWSDGVEYLNPDQIALDKFGDWNSEPAVLKAAEWTKRRREELLSARQGIAFETVFSSKEKLDFLQRAKKAGYFLRFFFIGTSDPQINVRRVKKRVAEGGHDVPRDKIVVRYERCMTNLAAAIRWSDRAYVYDNSIDDAAARLCARTVDGWLQRTYGNPVEWVEDAISGLPKHDDYMHRNGLA